MKRKMTAVLSLAAALVLAFASCSGGGETEVKNVSVTELTSSVKSLTLYEGETSSFTVSVAPQNASNKNFTVSSADESVASAVVEGEEVKVTGLKEGETKITVTSEDGAKKCTVKVSVTEKIAVESVTLSEDSITVGKDLTTYVEVEILPENASNKNFTVSLSDEGSNYLSYAIEGSLIAITGLAATEEDVLLTVTSADSELSDSVNVKVEIIPTLTLAYSAVQLSKGETSEVEIIPVNIEGYENLELTVENEDPTVVKAEIKDGKLYLEALTDGESKVTVKAGEYEAELEVTVQTYVAVSSVTVSGDKSVMVSESIKLTADVQPSDATNKDVSWTSSDEKIASVDSEGNVTGVKAGNVTITASADGIEGTYEITVTKYQAPPQALPVLSEKTKIDGASLRIHIDSSSMKATWGDNLEKLVYGTDFDVSLSSGTIKEVFLADPSSGSDGYIDSFVLFVNMADASVQTTNAEVSITVNDVTYTGTVEFVNSKWVPGEYTVEGIVLSPSSKTLGSSSSVTFIATDTRYGLEQEVEWSISPETGSITQDGVYTAPSSITESSEVTVTAKYSETISATAKITLLKDGDLPAFSVELSNSDGGAWMFIDIYPSSSDDALSSSDNSALENVSLSVDGDANSNVSYCTSLENGGVRYARSFGSANLTSSSVSQILTFTIKTSAGKKYSGKVAFNGASKTSMDVTETSFELVKEIALSSYSENFVALDASSEVTVSAVGIDDFDLSNVEVVSSSESIVTASYDKNGKITLTSVAEGDAEVTVTYGTYSKKITVNVTVGGSGISWSTIDYLGDGAGGGSYSNKYKFCAVDGEGTAINIQQPGFVSKPGIYVTFSAGISECSLGDGCHIEGASIVFYLDSITAKETLFTFTMNGNTYNAAIYFEDGAIE